ncbi:MAG: FlgO family outer membrane protein, partial [Desulfobacterales bacterium]
AVILPDNPAQRKTAADRDPPMITLKGWTSFQTVYVPKICLEVQVRDEGTITAVTVNRTPVLRKRSLHVIFSWFLELTEGENRIRIEARDAAGNLAVQELVIERRIPEAVKLDARHKVTLLPFETGNEPADAGTFFQDRLIDAFVTQDRFRVVERNLFDLILQEQKLSQSQLVDRRTALKIGQLAAANSIVAGSIVVTRNGIEVVSRLIDTETSEILATADAFDEVADIYDLGSLAEALALKYHRDFPLVSGIVIDRQGDTILTDLGLQEVRKQRCILIYREDDVRHPVTGTSLGTDKKIVGRARFTQVDADFSKAELLDGSPGAVQTLQKVITE